MSAGMRRSTVALAAVALAGGAAGGAVVALSGAGDGADAPVTVAPGGAGPAAASWAAIARRAARGVVEITTSRTITFGGRGSVPKVTQTQVAFGSGFVIDKSGDIVTNEHVVGDADALTVHLPDGTVAPGKLLGADASIDLAVVRIEVPGSHLHPLAFGSAGSLTLGAPVLAIGTPFGYAGSVSAGIVSGFDREIESPNGYTLGDAIQTDAAVNHGNSGGPLLDAAGKVVGVNTQLANSGVNGNVGVAFAIPIDAGNRKVIAELRTRGRASHAWLGIAGATLDEQLATAIGLPDVRGVLVTAIAPDSPAARAGLETGSYPVKLDTQGYCAGGDVLTAIGGMRIASVAAMENALERYRPGAVVRIGVVHADGTPATPSVELTAQPAKPPEFDSSC